MRNILLITAFLYVAQPLWAAGHRVEIDSQLFFQGQKVAAPRIVTNQGEKAKVIMSDQKNNREYNLEVYPQVVKQGQYQLQYSLAVLEVNDEIITRGSVDLQSNKNARISIDQGRIELILKIKAT
jgi:hypothetical protein